MAKLHAVHCAITDASGEGYSRRLSNTIDVELCVAALEEAIARHGRPDIFNTNEGLRFTSFAFTATRRYARIRISMDGHDRWMDNVFVERLWRLLKYECVFLNAFETGTDARSRIGQGKWGETGGLIKPRIHLSQAVKLARKPGPPQNASFDYNRPAPKSWRKLL